MRQFFVYVFIIFFAKISFSKNYKAIDSLKSLVSNKKNQDTNTVNIYGNIANYFLFNKPDSGIYYANFAYYLARKLHYTEGEFRSLKIKAFALALTRSDSAAVSCAYQVIKMAETSKDKKHLINAYFTLASVYMHIREYKKSIIFHRKVLTYLNKTNANFYYGCTEHLAECFAGLKQPDSTYLYATKTLEQFKWSSRNRPFDIYLMGYAFFLKNQYEDALKYYRKGLQMSDKQSGKVLSDFNIGIAAIFQKKGMVDSGIYYAGNALKITVSNDILNERLEALTMLTTLYEEKAEIDSAFKYQKYTSLLRDSIYNLDKIKAVQLIAFNDRLDKQAELDQQEKIKNKIIIYSLVIFLIFSLLVVFLILKNNRQRKQAYNRL